MNKILKVIIDFDIKPKKNRISVAVKIADNQWRAFYRVVSEISLDSIHEVIKTGEVLSSTQARIVFPSIYNELSYSIKDE
jgi:hypothetical protein